MTSFLLSAKNKIKKYGYIVVAALFLLLAVIFYFLFSFTKKDNSLAGLSNKRISEIEEAFAAYYDSGAKLVIDKESNAIKNSYGSKTLYYGSYGSCAVFFAETIMPAEDEKEIAGYVFKNPNMFDILVYNKGILVNLQTAYKLGWLNKRQLKKLYKVHTETSERVIGN